MSDDDVGKRSGISWRDHESSVYVVWYVQDFGILRRDGWCGRHVGWGKGSIFSLFEKDEWWHC